MTTSCNKFYLVVSGDGCYDIAASKSISLEIFYAWNPAIGSDCAALWLNTYVCVGLIGGGTPTPKPISTPTPTSARPTSTSVGNGIATPTPVQPSMIANCNKFYFVKTGDGCYDIAASNSISLDQFYAFNPYVQTDCSKLWVGYNVCVGIVGGSTPMPTPTPTPVKPTSTSVGNGVATPSPVQPSMVSNCNGFYLVKAGDGCFDIAAANGISTEQFYAWNPYVNNDCSRLWSGYNVCVRTIGFTPPKSSTFKTVATSTKPASSTPTPVQPGMVNNCKKFYKVQAGDGCWAIADTNKISLDDFYKWNPSVKTDCSALWGQYYVCVGI
jgi:LysM repeat protein